MEHVTRSDLEVPVGAERLACWHYRGTDALATPAGRPCVVMAHGLGGVRDSALTRYAERFAAAGLDVLLFDYRGFGDSGGGVRDDVSHRRQRDDYRAVLAHAHARRGIDPARVALWGTSYSGGHVVAVAADEPGVAAVVAQGAAMDGLAATLLKRRTGGTRTTLRLVGRGLVDAMVATRWVPVAAPAGEVAALNTPDSADGYAAVSGSHDNRMRARGLLLLPLNRPVRVASRVRVPMLLQTAEHDAIAPVSAMEKVAARAPHARLERYDAGHFDLYLDPVFEDVVSAQVAFLREVLSP